MRTLPVAMVLGLAAMLSGVSCGSASSDSSGDGGTDGATSEGGTDSGALDAAPREDGARDAATDAPPSNLDVVLAIDSLFQDCMPSVSPDPVTVQGNLAITNNGASAVGPIAFKSGTFLNAKTLAPLATFQLDTTSQVVQPGAKTQTLVEKTQDTMVPAGGCQTLACNTELVVELAYTGPGVPAGAVVRAPAKTISCAF